MECYQFLYYNSREYAVLHFIENFYDIYVDSTCLAAPLSKIQYNEPLIGCTLAAGKFSLSLNIRCKIKHALQKIITAW